MTPAGMGGAIQAMIEAGFVDLIISTGANVYHDLAWCNLRARGEVLIDFAEEIRRCHAATTGGT